MSVSAHPLTLLFERVAFNPTRMGVLLCEMESFPVQDIRGSTSFKTVPTRIVRSWETEEIKNGEPIRPTFLMDACELKALANELANVGIFPTTVPKSEHIDDLRKERDHLKSIVMVLLSRPQEPSNGKAQTKFQGIE